MRSFAQKAGIKNSTFQSVLNGAKPTIDTLTAISQAAGVSIDWLATGRDYRPNDPAEPPSYIGVPRYDIELSAGSGSFNDRAELLDHIPFTPQFLMRKLGRKTADGLVILEARGDSMEPTIGDGDLVLVDQKMQALADGVMAFVLDDVAYIKRIRSFLGDIEIISDNRELYPPQLLPRKELNRFHIIGRVRWCGHLFVH